MDRHRIVIGDWSGDGHGKCDYYTFECNATEEELKEAYHKAVKKCKVSLHEDHDRKKMKDITSICYNYEDKLIREPQYIALKELGIDFTDIGFKDDCEENELKCWPDDIPKIFLEMVKTQIPGFEYKMVEEARTINGFWSKDFNHSFGYGCY